MNELINNPPDPSVEGIGDELPASLMGKVTFCATLKYDTGFQSRELCKACLVPVLIGSNY